MTIATGVAIRIEISNIWGLEMPFKSCIDIEKENDDYDQRHHCHLFSRTSVESRVLSASRGMPGPRLSNKLLFLGNGESSDSQVTESVTVK
jgi:hypothetical protein